jgi:hypothetical protein
MPISVTQKGAAAKGKITLVAQLGNQERDLRLKLSYCLSGAGDVQS